MHTVLVAFGLRDRPEDQPEVVTRVIVRGVDRDLIGRLERNGPTQGLRPPSPEGGGIDAVDDH
jgi:hypothetical protein